MLFTPYRLQNPRTEQNIFIGRWSYLWAGLLGAVYVAEKGIGSRFLLAAAINVGVAMVVLAITGVTSFVFAAKQQFFLILVGIPAVVIMQGMVTVNIIREGYRRRG